jgi:hypothetical protein
MPRSLFGPSIAVAKAGLADETEDMPLDLSRLTQSILPVIALVKGSPLSPDESVRVEAAVRDHSFEGQEAPTFLLAWFQVLADGKACDEVFFVPTGYPEGGSGLVNVLADINEHVVSLDIEDQGEWFSWRIPAFGLRAFIIRETNIRDGYLGAIRPLDEDSNGWLLAEYQRLRQGGKLKHLA